MTESERQTGLTNGTPSSPSLSSLSLVSPSLPSPSSSPDYSALPPAAKSAVSLRPSPVHFVDSTTALLPEALDGPIAGADQPPLKLPRAPYLFGVLAALTTFAYGFNTGIIAVALISIQQHWGLATNSATVTCIVSAMLAGAVVGSMLPGWFGTDTLGRKPMLLVTNGLLIAGAIGSAASTHVVTLIVARIVVGVGMGMASVLPGLYITEMSPASIRGLLGTLNQCAGYVGIVCSYCVGLLYVDASWMFGWGALVASGALLAAAAILPESPRWLISRGRNQEALSVLSAVYGRHNGRHFTDEFAEIYARLSRPQSRTRLPSRTTGIIVALQVIQQAAASGFVTYYSAAIFRSWGLSPHRAILLTALSAMPQLLVFLVVARWADVWGRRRLLLTSEAAMMLVLFFLGVLSVCAPVRDGGRMAAPVLVFIGLTAHRMAYALGLAPVPTVLIAEILPFSQRSRGLALALTLNWSLNLLVTSAIPTVAALQDSLAGVYFCLGFMALGGFFFIQRRVFETRGMLLEVVEEMHLFPVMPADPREREQLADILVGSRPLKPPLMPAV